MRIVGLFKIFALLLMLSIGASAHPAWAIVVDDRNQVYVSDLFRIWKIDAEGKISVAADRHTHELTLDAYGNLLGEELTYNPADQKFKSSLWKLTPDGRFSFLLAPTDAPPNGVSIWRNKRGASYYFGQTETEPRDYFLLKRAADGKIKTLFGNRAAAQRHRQVVSYSFAGMTFAPDGDLYFKNNSNIWKAAPDDAVTGVVTETEFGEFAPVALFGIAVDAKKNIYTADYNSKKVLKIGADKKIAAIHQTAAEWSPTGVYFKNKNLYVLENKTVPVNAAPVLRVVKIAADGKSSIIGTIGETQTPPAPTTGQNNFSNPTLDAKTDYPVNKICAVLAVLFACGLVFKTEIGAAFGKFFSWRKQR